jgi:plastocyanin
MKRMIPMLLFAFIASLVFSGCSVSKASASASATGASSSPAKSAARGSQSAVNPSASAVIPAGTSLTAVQTGFTPTADITPAPTAEPTPVPTAEPTPVPTVAPTDAPTATPVPTATPQTYQVHISGFAFNPPVLHIKAGDSVIWDNQDPTGHSIVMGTFASATMSTGQTVTRQFNALGTFEYHCGIHSFMTGQIIVE